MQKSVLVLISVFCVQSQAWRYAPPVSLHEGSSCEGILNQVGVCTLLRKCEPFVTNRIRYTDLKRCSFAGTEEVICCPHVVTPTITLNKRISPNAETPLGQEAPKRRPAKIACDLFSEILADRIATSVFGQKFAALGEFPHIGLIYYYNQSIHDIGCVASLISERFAITAATCVDKSMKPLRVRFGTIEWTFKWKKSHYVDAQIKTVIQHSGYRTGSRIHDIAIIEFTAEVPFSAFVSPACLQTETVDLPSTVGLQVVGWSTLNKATIHRQNHNRARSDFLLVANMTTIDLRSCINDYKNYLDYQKLLNERNERLYCAIDNSKTLTDTCYGDYGGPLMLETEELWKIIGIVSSVNPCGVRLPNVFHRISYYLNWIEEIVWSPHSKPKVVSRKRVLL